MTSTGRNSAKSESPVTHRSHCLHPLLWLRWCRSVMLPSSFLCIYSPAVLCFLPQCLDIFLVFFKYIFLTLLSYGLASSYRAQVTTQRWGTAVEHRMGVRRLELALSQNRGFCVQISYFEPFFFSLHCSMFAAHNQAWLTVDCCGNSFSGHSANTK